MKFKKIAALLMAACMVASLAGCGGGSDSSSSNAGTEDTADADTSGDTDTADAATEDAAGAEEEAPQVAPGKKGTIEFWTVFTGADGTSMQAMVDAYNATEPDYTVNHRAMEANDLYLKMPLAIQSGEDVPDVCINHVERVPLFQEQGFLTDYTGFLDGSEVKAENYNPKAWAMTELDGGHYGVPLDVHTYVLYANMDLYEKYGNGVLDDGILTWDEVKSVADACVADEIIPIGMAWLRVKFLASYAQLGGTLSTDGNTPDFNNEKAVQVLENWNDIMNSGYGQKEGDDSWQLFLAGKVLFCPEGIWMYNNVKEAGLNAQMFDYPVFDAGTKGNWTSSHQFVLPKNDSRDDEKTMAVLDFINFMGNNSLEWAKAGQCPAHVSIKDVAEFQDMPQAFLADENDELKIYDYKYYGYAVESLDTVLGEVLWGRTTPQEALDQAVQETKDKIEMSE
ncbi:MAG: extracellular solute-binding protein [Lachnospiraceae bacterium]|nr:extracellular solute-binding protein [Lachnospiraceae bacterium]MCI9095110.1 extracellular solute-binding protein [Lachnospiraceae bacterium]MCI9203602.1 extracellular solute-binding protein [Lachnospiraceae bacterium]